MTTFSQWWKGYDARGKIHDHYYVLGPERVLVDEVVDIVVAEHQVAEWNRHNFVVGIHPDAQIWDSLYSTSLDGGPSLTIVYGADQLSNSHLIPDLVQTKPKTHVVVFVSNAVKIEREREEQEDGTFKQVLPSYLQGFEKRGRVIECTPFTQSTAKVAVAWVQSKMEARENALVHLLNASNGDLRLVRDVVTKLKWIGEPATVRAVSVLLKGEPSDTFTDALLALDKKTAMVALRKISSSEYLQLIGHLDAQIDLAGRVHDMLVQHKTVPEIMRAVGSQAFLVPSISKIAKHYSGERRAAIRNLLAEADRRTRSGNNEGVMESLIALW